jgi:hypothetical protein
MHEPPRIITLTAEELKELIETAVARALSGDRNQSNENGHEDRWLSPEQAAKQFNVSIEWIYRHARKWSFVSRPSRKCTRISETGLRRWMDIKKITSAS